MQLQTSATDVAPAAADVFLGVCTRTVGSKLCVLAVIESCFIAGHGSSHSRRFTSDRAASAAAETQQ